MVLPTGVDKATGLPAALDELGLPARDCVGVIEVARHETPVQRRGRAE